MNPPSAEAQDEPESASEPGHLLLHMPVDVRSASLALLAVLATIFVMHWASEVFIPVMLGLVLSYALSPLVTQLVRLRLPRAVASALLLLGLVAGVGWTGYSLSDDATQFVEALPDAAQKIRRTMHASRNRPDSALDKVQKAATQLEQAAEEGSAKAAPPVERGVTRVQIERPHFNLNDYLLSHMPSMAAAVGQTVVVLFITFFLLASGDNFRRKIVHLAGPTFARRKLTVQALDEITEQIQRYLLVQVMVSVLVGVATWLAYMALGVEHAAVWGALGFLLNFVPYIGSIVIVAGSATVGFVQFGTFDMALLVGGVALTVHTVSGYLITPWLTSRASRMNAVAVFIGLLAFGWLWGVWGLVLGVPILLMIKSVCDRVDEFKVVGELLDA